MYIVHVELFVIEQEFSHYYFGLPSPHMFQCYVYSFISFSLLLFHCCFCCCYFLDCNWFDGDCVPFACFIAFHIKFHYHIVDSNIVLHICAPCPSLGTIIIIIICKFNSTLAMYLNLLF